MPELQRSLIRAAGVCGQPGRPPYPALPQLTLTPWFPTGTLLPTGACSTGLDEAGRGESSKWFCLLFPWPQPTPLQSCSLWEAAVPPSRLPLPDEGRVAYRTHTAFACSSPVSSTVWGFCWWICKLCVLPTKFHELALWVCGVRGSEMRCHTPLCQPPQSPWPRRGSGIHCGGKGASPPCGQG